MTLIDRLWLTGVILFFSLLSTDSHANWTIAKRPQGCTAHIKQRGSNTGITVAYFPKTEAVQIAINNMPEEVKENTIMVISFFDQTSEKQVFQTKVKAIGIDGNHAMSENLPVEIIDAIGEWQHIEVRYSGNRILSMDLNGSKSAMADLRKCVAT